MNGRSARDRLESKVQAGELVRRKSPNRSVYYRRVED